MRKSKSSPKAAGADRASAIKQTGGGAPAAVRDENQCDHHLPGPPAVPEQIIRPSALRAMFMRPAYLDRSAWLEHVPFAFWLTEAHRPRVLVELGTHHGVSYFAFCQAVARLGLATRCFAIDTWQGDEHAGFYGEEVFAKVRAYNDAQYSAFSRLVRSSFNDALTHFSDGSIDLLHIDGLHTLEAVREDFDNWRPKLSERGVVVLHDSNVRERNFGVFHLVEELRELYPSFEFAHGHGLAVLGVGTKQSEPLKSLFDAARDDRTTRMICEIFAHLGRAAADAQAVQEFRTETQSLEAAVSEARMEAKRLRQALEQTRAERDARAREADLARARLTAQSERQAEERGRLIARAEFDKESQDAQHDDRAHRRTRAHRD